MVNKKFSILFLLIICTSLVSAILIGGNQQSTYNINSTTVFYNGSNNISGNPQKIPIFNSATSLIGSNNFTFNSTANQLTLNRNTATTSAPTITGTAFRINCGDNEACRLGITSFGIGGTSGFSTRSARGTGASPTATQSGDLLGQYDAYGRSTSAWTLTPRAILKIFASENYNDTAQGAYFSFWTTKKNSIIPTESLRIDDGQTTITGTLNVTGDMNVIGNLSAKRYYWTGYDNSTQPSAGTTVVNIVNVSNNNDIDAYGIKVVGRQNVTFEHTGDYLCILSPEFYQASGGTALVTFWIQKNGVDVKWSNSRFSIPNGGYNAPSIAFQFDITNPATDYIRFMWWSDSATTVLYSSGDLTSPTRPSIPAVLLNCQKISEIT